MERTETPTFNWGKLIPIKKANLRLWLQSLVCSEIVSVLRSENTTQKLHLNKLPVSPWPDDGYVL